MNVYEKGQTVDLGPEEFRDATGALVAADSVTVTIRDGTGSVVAPGAITTSVTGVYHSLVTVAQGPGIWRYKWDFVKGTSHAVHEGEFFVSGALGDTPDGSALTTVEAVKRFLQTENDDNGQDALIWELINRASAAIMELPGVPQLRPVALATARKFIHRGGPVLDLSPYCLSAAPTLVRLDTDTATPTTMTVNVDYQLRPVNPVTGVYGQLRLLSLSDIDVRLSTTRDYQREIQITADWGAAVIPQVVEHAAIVTVTEWLRRGVQAFSTTLNTEAGILDRPEAVPHAARAALRRWKGIGSP